MRTFTPRASPEGWASSLGLVIGLAALLGLLTWLTPSPRWYDFIAMIGIGALGFIALVFLLFYASMRYEVGGGMVVLRCGFLSWTIPAIQIRSMEERDLQVLGYSAAWRCPGFGLFRLVTRNLGMVRMCASSGGQRVLVLHTSREKWGVTPQDVLGFSSAVERERAQSRVQAAHGGTGRAD